MYKLKESDWKLFRKKLPEWQEAFMERLDAEYIGLLKAPGLASTKFWELEKRIRQDKSKTGVIVTGVSRTGMEMNLMSLLQEGAITFDDLEGFSEELQDRLREVCGRGGHVGERGAPIQYSDGWGGLPTPHTKGRKVMPRRQGKEGE